MRDDCLSLAQAKRQERQVRMIAVKRANGMEIQRLRRVDNHKLERRLFLREVIQILHVAGGHDVQLWVASSQRERDRLAQ